jgi:hypothetical protein
MAALGLRSLLSDLMPALSATMAGGGGDADTSAAR